MKATVPHVAAAERMRQLPEELKRYAGFGEAVAALAAGRPASFDGVWGSACALVAAALAEAATGPLVVVAPTQRVADDLAADLEIFTATSPVIFPAWESEPDERLVHDETFGDRLRVVKGLLQVSGFRVQGSGDGGRRSEIGGQNSEVRGQQSEVGDQRSEVRVRRSNPQSAIRNPQLPEPRTLNPEPLPLLVTCIQALLQPSPPKDAIAAGTRVLPRGERIDLEAFLKWLVERGFHATTAVELPGEFSHRGGILDLYAPDWLRPVRVELFDDEIESLRSFDLGTQRSQESLDEIDVTVLGKEAYLRMASGGRDHFTDYLPADSWLLLVEPEKLSEEGKSYLQKVENPSAYHSVASVLAECSRFGVATTAELAAGTAGIHCHLPFESVERFSGDIGRIRDELDTIAALDDVYLVTPTEAEIERLRELLSATKLASSGRLHFSLGSLTEGFRLRIPLPLGEGGERSEPGEGGTKALRPHPSPLPKGEGNGRSHYGVPPRGLLILTGSELFHRGELRRLPRRRLGKAIDSFLDLREGDLVVHLAHGIGRYRGLRLIEKQGQHEEHLEIEFDGGTRMFVPAVKIDLVQKYVGGTKTRPSLAKIGGKSWVKQKQAAEGAVHDLAVELLEMQAIRASRPGIAFGPDSDWQREFDASFPYHETPDQLAAISAIKSDMHRPRPMDRLLCGDVGFGKTEVAMRAAFKAVDNGYQVAVLVPTTILAEQHFHSFSERMAEFPVGIAKLSRFCTPEEERTTLAGLKTGGVDIVIGTHRVASRDVEFHNLGLVIIDEEQRFGVDVKERLKTFRATVDVLTLSATPIPRTLHMSLVGLRDISNLETPPEDRLAVETRVARWDEGAVRHATLRELARGGQIYFVHNRVNDIELVANRLRRIVPEARLRIGHAQMPDDELEEVMVEFVAGKFDLLLATTIVESGLDIPNANTIFIDESDRYGLADLHQLRGRVGRYKHRAYAHLLIEPHKHLTPNAARRLRAIEEFSEMGAGFAIAMRDLEIRGAGNLLGTQQSGHIAAVGYELYCQLLENAVRTLQNMPGKMTLDVDVNLPGDAFLPADYIADLRMKIDLYRRLTRVTRIEELSDLKSELVDRFGPPPPPTVRLLTLAELKMDAAVWQIGSISIEEQFIVFRYANRQRIEQLARMRRGQLRIVDDRSAYLPIPRGFMTPDRLLSLAKSVLQPGEQAPIIPPA
jgi:transcription-repair coupling factor (superfamily II helicase)